MQLKHIGLTAVVTLLASVSTSTSALATLRYSPEATPNPYILELENPQIAQTPSRELVNWLNKGISLIKAGNYAEAVKAYDQAIKINGESADAWMGRGFALYGLEKYPEAVTAFNQATEFDPSLVGAWVGLGMALDDTGKPEDAPCL